MAVPDRQSGSGANPSERLLALEIRPRRAGFVVLEGNSKLLDWGVRTYGRHPDRLVRAGKKFSALTEFYCPTVVVIRRRSGLARSTAEAVNEIVVRVRSKARRHSVEFRSVTAKTVYRFFDEYDASTKHKIAITLAARFGELAWRLPAKRKSWQSEHYNSLIFDAAATAIAFLGIDCSDFLGAAYAGLSPDE